MWNVTELAALLAVLLSSSSCGAAGGAAAFLKTNTLVESVSTVQSTTADINEDNKLVEHKRRHPTLHTAVLVGEHFTMPSRGMDGFWAGSTKGLIYSIQTISVAISSPQHTPAPSTTPHPSTLHPARTHLATGVVQRVEPYLDTLHMVHFPLLPLIYLQKHPRFIYFYNIHLYCSL